jgi:signal transduction histidine kinase
MRLQLRSRLFWQVFIIVLIGLGLTSIGMAALSLQAIDDNTHRALEERLVLSQAIAGRVDDYLHESTRHVEILIESEGIAQHMEDEALAQEFVEKVKYHLGNFAYFTVLLDNSRQVVSMAPYNEEVMKNDFTSAKCVEFVSVHRTPVITRAFVLGAPTHTVALVIPILDKEQTQVGTLFTALNLTDEVFTRLLKPCCPGTTGHSEIVDSTGLVLASTQPENLWKEDGHGEQFDQLVSDRRSVVGTCHTCHIEDSQVIAREDEVMAFAPLASAQWGVALRQSSQEAFTFASILKKQLAVYFSVALLAGVGITWMFTKRIVRPIEKLTSACQEITEGNLSVEVPLEGPGEIGRLGSSFALMRNRLKESLNQIQNWADELEDRIRLRTTELEESQEKLQKANRELSVLNTVGDALRQSLNLTSTMNTALERMIELSEAGFGCIFLKQQENQEPVIAAQSSRDVDFGITRLLPALRSHVTNIFSKERADAFKMPLRSIPLNNHREVDYFIATFIPLIGKESIPGVMVLVKKNHCGFSIHEKELYRSIGIQIGISIENALLFQRLLQKEESLSQLVHKLIAAQEEERRRIARELHDETSQSLTALSVGLRTAIMAKARTPEEVKKRLGPLDGMASGMLEEISRMIQDLRPSLLDDMGLLSALDWYADVRLRSRGIQVSWEIVGIERRLPLELETTIFRLGQEAISNVAKHAKAESVTILIEFLDHHIVLEIDDDGNGFDAEQILSNNLSSMAYGLLGMRERVDLFGGVLTIDSRVGVGTRVRAELPVMVAPVADITI